MKTTESHISLYYILPTERYMFTKFIDSMMYIILCILYIKAPGAKNVHVRLFMHELVIYKQYIGKHSIRLKPLKYGPENLKGSPHSLTLIMVIGN